MGGFLTADREKLWKLAKAKSRKAFERDSELVLAEYIEVEVNSERMLKHPRMAAQYMNALELWMKKKEAGEASKAARMAGLQTIQPPLVPPPSHQPTVQ